MGSINERLERSCRAEPNRRFPVVITLAESFRDLSAQELEIDARSVGGVPGILVGTLAGELILELIDRDEVLEVTEDDEVSI